MAAYTLTPTAIGGAAPGWALTGPGIADASHPRFDTDISCDVEQAMDWAEEIIGARQAWWHMREQGRDRWEAVTTR